MAVTYYYVVLFISAGLAAAAQIMFKSLSAGGFEALLSLKGISAVAFYGLAFLTYYFSLRHIPLHIAYQFAVITYVAVTVGGAMIFGERVNGLQHAGVAAVAFGMLLIIHGAKGGA